MLVHHYSYGIVVFEKAIPYEYCDIIAQILTLSETPVMTVNHLTAGYKKGTQYNEKLFNIRGDAEFTKLLLSHIQDLKRAYFSIIGLDDQEQICSFDDPIIKQYCASRSDQFTLHFDSQGGNAKRSLAMIWYLNDVNAGGETVFPHAQVSIKPEKGSCLVFPPFWNFPHLARAPLSNDKLTLNSFGQVL